MLLLFDGINVSLISIALVNFVLGLVIYFGGREQKISVIYTWNIFTIVGWAVAMILFRSAPAESGLFWCIVLYIIPTFIASSFLHFTYIFPSQSKDVNKWKKLIIFLINAIVVILVAIPGLIIDEVNIRQGLEKEIVFGNLYIIYFLYIMLVFSYGFLRLFKKHRQSNHEEKNKIAFLLFGYALAANSAFITNLVMPWMGNYMLNWVGQVFTISMVISIVYSMYRYLLFDIKVIAAEVFSVVLSVLIFLNIFSFQSNVELVLNIILFIGTLIFGMFLIKSVKKEVERKEELQILSNKLAKANVELKKLDNAKSEFISIASHQLRTPLTSIKGYVSLITEGTFGKIDARVRDALNKVYISNERLIQLVENLLNVSRIESGRMEYTFEKHKIEDVVKELMDNFIFAAKKKDLYVKASLPKKALPEIVFDRPKVTEVISNMIDNSIKYTNKGGVTVEVKEVNGSIRVTVSDTGIGIPKESIGELFKKFSRGKDTDRLQASGTGLGMFVAKNIMDAHKGKIWAESDGDGKGSRFIIELPLKHE